MTPPELVMVTLGAGIKSLWSSWICIKLLGLKLTRLRELNDELLLVTAATLLCVATPTTLGALGSDMATSAG